MACLDHTPELHFHHVSPETGSGSPWSEDSAIFNRQIYYGQYGRYWCTQSHLTNKFETFSCPNLTFCWYFIRIRNSMSSECDINGLPMPPDPPASRLSSSLLRLQADYDTLSEKYWGEILERTVSSSSLQTLKRAYDQPTIVSSSSSLRMKPTNSE